MQIVLHIGLPHCGANRLQSVLAAKRDQLTVKGTRYARAPGNKNHTRLWMAVTDPDHIDPLRFNRGYITAEKQATLREALARDLAKEVETHDPERLILSASQLPWLARREELDRLRALLAPLSEDIRILAHVDEPAALMARIYADQVMEGRGVPLDRELALAAAQDWWQGALKSAPAIDPAAGQFLETQGAPFWLDFAALVAHWETVFGPGSVALRGYDRARFEAETVTDEIRAAFGIEEQMGKAQPASLDAAYPAAWLARGRQLNELILRVLAKRSRILPRPLWRSFISEIRVEGDPIDPATLSPLSGHFAKTNATLAKAHDGLDAGLFKRPRARPDWTEADPTRGFRASQYLLQFMWRINKATKEERKGKGADLARVNGETEAPARSGQPGQGLSDTARKLLPPLAQQNFAKLSGGPYAPHNRIGMVDEEQLAAPFDPAPPRDLPEGSTGTVVLGCMKNEAPYIVEWVAYHRAIGVDNFLIYTNDCSDGTAEILDRLQDLGVLQHRNNDNWKGNSPQQHALNKAQKEDVIRHADWIAHIDVDEFINVRCGNGTIADFLERVPDATNVAMTWRLFGHNGVTRLADEFVIDQFDTCAPRFCPKPHTVWGFKTMFRNIGAYEKISCHRPNKLDKEFEGKVRWVNGSGKDMTRELAKNGWRSSKKSIGYDLLQLNHYALRSAESFLIKRQRGRALHVDRSIGLSYWIRMDWSDHRDVTIKRNLPRLRAEYDRLMSDERLADLHAAGLDWHRAKADELHANPEFQELYAQALETRLSATERVAYALALDTDS